MSKQTPTSNSLFVIWPYRDRGTWMFDDPAVGLVREPFVAGIPAMIEQLVAEVPEAAKGFKLVFSAQPFPSYQVEVERVREEAGGAWYRWGDKEGWLCPALLKYFSSPPARLFCRAEAQGG